MMDINEIIKILPHRYPFLLVDKIVEFEKGERIVGYKNVTINEPFFEGHFPKRPVMPGVLILEAMAQVCGVLAFKSEGENAEGNRIVLLAGLDKIRYKRPVEPGDRLDLAGKINKIRRGMCMFSAEASVDGELVASADIICTLKDI
ncbi:MAG: 3-hydroxyacyl-[acyl-carrier-protein] dehydratase FabZ [Gammaproteobacteria bacterium]|nr:MAG: 3-hydroxyacyl-[acyl-carrier-protein] dehydratase FabZ [Gammaproteobacteria bacterium]